jgi:hypothetical protein
LLGAGCIEDLEHVGFVFDNDGLAEGIFNSWVVIVDEYVLDEPDSLEG